jgi:hypothetical protein
MLSPSRVFAIPFFILHPSAFILFLSRARRVPGAVWLVAY